MTPRGWQRVAPEDRNLADRLPACPGCGDLCPHDAKRCPACGKKLRVDERGGKRQTPLVSVDQAET